MGEWIMNIILIARTLRLHAVFATCIHAVLGVHKTF